MLYDGWSDRRQRLEGPVLVVLSQRGSLCWNSRRTHFDPVLEDFEFLGFEFFLGGHLSLGHTFPEQTFQRFSEIDGGAVFSALRISLGG